ncbi:helix-turn-helix domain-containing protein [Streptomyces europaeiscabiei]|uniref:helix-turn-helix domain-containing protein n=1 Tax=Streptomyces europaeiscabiei TaxID=146819 RepID=UPI0029ADE07A|nr:helix-turn-helix transcriptional regulator [Streptomyces europaeiscabiei]MDX3839066.1 helix-turn-helix transcriptional regulator [Streptomyces europaeiscabiei]
MYEVQAPDDDWIPDQLRIIGDHIRAERVRRNLTQERLYLAAGISRWTLQEIEAGRGNPSARTLLRLARALGVPLAQLVDGPAAATGDAGGGP